MKGSRAKKLLLGRFGGEGKRVFFVRGECSYWGERGRRYLRERGKVGSGEPPSHRGEPMATP